MSSFTRQNLKKTVRKSAGDGRTYIFPHRLSSGPATRMREMKARLKIAIRYFETMVGRRRSEMDPEAVVSLFGDHKLARGLVVAMARFYRYRRLDFSEVVPAEVAARLRERGLGNPPALRSLVFRRVNVAPEWHGFAAEAGRDPLLEAVAAEVGLDAAQLDELLWLDSEENWVLSRLATPDPADLLAIYDYLSLETMLRYSSKIEITLAGAPPAGFHENLQFWLDQYGVRGEIGVAGGARKLTLHGKADALGSWARHGWRLVRVLTRLLALYPSIFAVGEADIELPNTKAVLRLEDEALELLGAGKVSDPIAGEPYAPAALRELRAATLPTGWRVRIDPEPLVFAGGILAPLALCSYARRPFYIVAAASEHEISHIRVARTSLLGRAELIVLAPCSLADQLKGVPTAFYTPGEPLDLQLVASQLLKLASSDSGIEAEDETQKALIELFTRVRREGFVPNPAVIEVLGEEPPGGELPGGRGVQQIGGFGLCSAGFLTRVKEVIDDQLEFYGARIVTLRQVAETLALNIPKAEEAGIVALEALVGALPEYVVVPRKLFEPYVRPLSRVTAGSVSAAVQAISRAA